MPTIVTLDMYSGRLNPTWELTEAQAAELRTLLARQTQRTALASPVHVGLLGYRGFELQTIDEAGMPARARAFDGVLDIGDMHTQNLLDEESMVERYLLSTAPALLTTEERTHVDAEISKNSRGGAGSKLLKGPAERVPPYDPAKWNKDPNICRSNNCYNYANDKITNTFAQPGRGSGYPGTPAFSCLGITPAAVHDGQVSIAKPTGTPKEGQYIALVIWPGNDYHWYRCDDNGKWSHKPGQTPARNTDNHGQLINSPETCDRGPYTVFCGYFHCIPANTRIL